MLLLRTPLLVLAIFVCSQSRNFHRHKVLKVARIADTDNQKSDLPLGIANLGHTCFMNSVLQSLYSTSAYRNQVLLQDYRSNSIGNELQRLFQSMQDKDSWFADPTKLAKALGINVRIQQDAEELLLDLVNRVDGSAVLGDGQELPSAKLRFESYQCIECLNVNFTKHKTQRNMDLSVDIEGHANLQDALRAHFKPEYLIGENQYQTKQFGLQDAKKSISFHKPEAAGQAGAGAEAKQGTKQLPVLPEVLVLHLKRFAFDPATSKMHKVGNPVEIPLSLNLSGLASTDDTQDTHITTGTATTSHSSSHRVGLPKVNSYEGTKDDKKSSREELQRRVEVLAAGLPIIETQAAAQQQGVQEQATTTSSCHDEYTLSSIVIHKGTLDSGHYYTLCRVREEDSETHACSAQKDHNYGTCSAQKDAHKGTAGAEKASEKACIAPARYKWLKFNDHVVTEISEAEALSKARGHSIPSLSGGASKGAYLVFYTRNHRGTVE